MQSRKKHKNQKVIKQETKRKAKRTQPKKTTGKNKVIATLENSTTKQKTKKHAQNKLQK